MLDEVGLTYPQYLVMVALWAKDDQTVSHLGDGQFLKSNTLTPLLKRLEAAGLIKRKRDDQDERVVRVTLTAAGRALQDRLQDIPDCILEATGLSSKALAKLTEELMAVRESLLDAAMDTDS